MPALSTPLLQAPDLVFLLVASAIAIQVFGAIWAYVDANRRGEDNPEYWIWVVGLPAIGLIGLIAYLHHRKQTKTTES